MNRLQIQLRDAVGLLIIGAEHAGLSEQEIKEVIQDAILGVFELVPSELPPIDADYEELKQHID